MDFVAEVYEVSKRLPVEEKFSLIDQTRRSAVSVASNIAEGEGRSSPADFKRFLSIAHGSLRECETQLLIAVRLGYLSEADIELAMDCAGEAGRLIQGLAKSLANK